MSDGEGSDGAIRITFAFYLSEAHMPDTVTPAPVVIAVEEQKPVPVVIEAIAAPGQAMTTTTTTASVPLTAIKGEGTTLAPRTTEQEDVVSEGQRKTAWLWERTQAITAIVVTTVTVCVLGWLSISPSEPSPNQLVAALQLNVMATLILANYFARTNHSKGGSGNDSSDKYQGR